MITELCLSRRCRWESINYHTRWLRPYAICNLRAIFTSGLGCDQLEWFIVLGKTVWWDWYCLLVLFLAIWRIISLKVAVSGDIEVFGPMSSTSFFLLLLLDDTYCVWAVVGLLILFFQRLSQVGFRHWSELMTESWYFPHFNLIIISL